MSQAELSSDSQLPAQIVEAVKASLDKTYAAFCSAKPEMITNGQAHHEGPCIAGTISFLGDIPWLFSWVLTHVSAPALAHRFAGFDIPFDSPDMGDLAGELVNVIAGEIVAQLEQRRIHTQMSLPIVARGQNLELVPVAGPAIVHLEYSSPEGPFGFRLAAAKSRPVRMPGK